MAVVVSHHRHSFERAVIRRLRRLRRLRRCFLGKQVQQFCKVNLRNRRNLRMFLSMRLCER